MEEEAVLAITSLVFKTHGTKGLAYLREGITMRHNPPDVSKDFEDRATDHTDAEAEPFLRLECLHDKERERD